MLEHVWSSRITWQKGLEIWMLMDQVKGEYPVETFHGICNQRSFFCFLSWASTIFGWRCDFLPSPCGWAICHIYPRQPPWRFGAGLCSRICSRRTSLEQSRNCFNTHLGFESAMDKMAGWPQFLLAQNYFCYIILFCLFLLLQLHVVAGLVGIRAFHDILKQM